MTPTRKDEATDTPLYKEITEIGNRVRYIQQRVGEFSKQLDDQYTMLEDLWETIVLPQYTGHGYDAGI